MQSTQTIQGKCVVHTLQQYLKLKYVGVDDYFCRYEYDAGERDPDVAAGERSHRNVLQCEYCKCNNPYNPDTYMVQCDTCKSWYISFLITCWLFVNSMHYKFEETYTKVVYKHSHL
ncbi:putative Zinc finger, FYVE/PHD-type, Zinc finger, RING/FYVE/PHD-type [Helianthus annuus]|nr:putative Zinc finger, FYVE/PHD-type, Zinc finger, RING/FYVE/PHD-type [Helianthus annuus]